MPPAAASRLSCTYFGVFDDVALRYPWSFSLGERRLRHLLVVELIHGQPVLLNDGYLVNHPLLREALLRRDGLLWALIRRGFVRVLHRGGSRYGLHEMPERMAAHIPSFAALVNDGVGGPPWAELRPRLERLDGQLREAGHLLDWPGYDAGSGVLALTEHLLERRATPHALGIGRHIGRHSFETFLRRTVDELRQDTRGARTRWEARVLAMAGDPDHTNRPQAFARAMMNLANELYQYNMGILLAAEHEAEVAVQTQISPAFDDLLIPPGLRFLATELQDLPRLHVPLGVADVAPERLAAILEPDSAVFEARAHWLALRAGWERAEPGARPARMPELHEAGRAYSARLAEHLGEHVVYTEAEELIDYVVGETVSDALKDGAKGLVAAGVASAAAWAGAGPAVAAAALAATPFVVAYGISRAQKKGLGSVFRKMRILAVERSLRLPPALLARSSAALSAIKRRRLPSTLQITPALSATVKPRLRRHVPED